MSSSDWLAEVEAPILIAFGAAAWTGGRGELGAGGGRQVEERKEESSGQGKQKLFILKLVPMQLNQILAESGILSEGLADNQTTREIGVMLH